MTEKDQISRLLEAKGIKPEEINYVLLSHLHPDHLGGASFFPHATFILTKKCMKSTKTQVERPDFQGISTNFF